MRLKHIVVSQQNYEHLKSLGKTGDSFNDVLTEIMKKTKIDTVANENEER